MTILLFVVVLVVLILVHEFGHFVAAKICGMRVDEFGIGYPPRLIAFRTRETLYSLNALPFGGFVKIYGEDSSDALIDTRAFGAQSRIKQAIVLLAGVAMNVVLAWLLFSAILMAPHWISDHEYAAPLPLVPALMQGAEVTVRVTQAVAVGLAEFFIGVFTFTADFSQITGPVGIAGAVGDAAQVGWQNLFSLTALISLNLAIVNLIPIPALDGGRLLFVMVEAIIRRPIKPSIAASVNAVGFLLLVLLMLVVTAGDLLRLAS